MRLDFPTLERPANASSSCVALATSTRARRPRETPRRRCGSRRPRPWVVRGGSRAGQVESEGALRMKGRFAVVALAQRPEVSKRVEARVVAVTPGELESVVPDLVNLEKVEVTPRHEGDLATMSLACRARTVATKDLVGKRRRVPVFPGDLHGSCPMWRLDASGGVLRVERRRHDCWALGVARSPVASQVAVTKGRGLRCDGANECATTVESVVGRASTPAVGRRGLGARRPPHAPEA